MPLRSLPACFHPCSPPQSVFCFIAYATIFWWHGICLSIVYNSADKLWR